MMCTHSTHTQALVAAAGDLKSRKFSWTVIHFHWVWLVSIYMYQFKIQYHKFTLWPSGDAMALCASAYIFLLLTKNSILCTLVTNCSNKKAFQWKNNYPLANRSKERVPKWTSLNMYGGQGQVGRQPKWTSLNRTHDMGPPLTDRMTDKLTDRHTWKHYLPSNNVCGW